jgi:TIR domain
MTVDFFISYTAADRAMAEWIAWQLEADGYTTVLQAWDFLPGSDFITQMHQALVDADRVLTVLSPAYLASDFSRAEWNAALASDPSGSVGTLLPVRVAEVNLQGFDLPRVYIDLVGLPEEEAKQRLLSGVRGARGMPTVEPEYPGRLERPSAVRAKPAVEPDYPSHLLHPPSTTETPWPTVQVRAFLCHSSSDKPTVRNLYRRLRADGISPWLDEEEILPGQFWETEIRKAIRSCDVVLVCLSKTSISKVGYVQKEIRYVLEVADEQPEGTIFLIPVRLEPCDVPDRFKPLQWVDLFDTTVGYERLMRSLRLVLPRRG